MRAVSGGSKARLRALDVHKRFASGWAIRGAPRPAVQGVTLEVAPGETLGLVGESGSGKTTVARIMAGLIRPSDGEVYFDNVRLDRLSRRERRRVRRHLQYVYQDPAASLNPRHRVGDLLLEPLKVHDVGDRADRRRRVESVLDALRLPTEMQSRYPHELSGGQQRRVGLARVLVLEPDILILDEPTAGLDVSVQAALLEVLADLKSAFGLTYVVVSHDLAVVESVCDRVAVMYAGEVVEMGTASALLASPMHPYTAELAASVPDVEGARKIDSIELREVDELGFGAFGCAFRPRCTRAGDECEARRPALRAADGDRFHACNFPLSIDRECTAPTVGRIP